MRNKNKAKAFKYQIQNKNDSMEKKNKKSNKTFFVKVASRKGLAYMLGDNKEAVKELNSLSDAEIQQAIDNIAVAFSFTELFERLSRIVKSKNKQGR